MRKLLALLLKCYWNPERYWVAEVAVVRDEPWSEGTFRDLLSLDLRSLLGVLNGPLLPYVDAMAFLLGTWAVI